MEKSLFILQQETRIQCQPLYYPKPQSPDGEPNFNFDVFMVGNGKIVIGKKYSYVS